MTRGFVAALVTAASISCFPPVAAGGAAATIHHPAPSSSWARTRCGSPASPGTDIPSAFAASVNPESVKRIFGYPRPQMVRPSYHSLNGLWEFAPMQRLAALAPPSAGPPGCKGAPNCDGARPPFGMTLNETVLVPFPVESCLSGLRNASLPLLPGSPPTYQDMFYRTLIDGRILLTEAAAMAGEAAAGEVLLHFGAVDWQCDVYVNGLWVGSHEGGFDAFSFRISEALELRVGSGELAEVMVVAHDPSNFGPQPFGKQRTSAMWSPAGDTYTTNSGIWQSVWLEVVPAARIESLKLAPNSTHLVLNVLTTNPPPSVGAMVAVTVTVQGVAVASGSGAPNVPFAIPIPFPRLWSPESPFLYNMSVQYGTDAVSSYFGMRDVWVGRDANGTARPCLSGRYRFLTGVLDQNFWPDGVYLAPGDEAMAFDLQAIKRFGHNYIRLHQKVNPDRWYYHADRLGIVVAQDVVQHYGDSVQGRGTAMQSSNGNARARYYWHDLKALVDGRGSHPCIFQFNTFNEQDMEHDFNVSNVVQWVQRYDSTRLVDADSGGPGNDLHVGDVDDLHVGGPSAKNPHRPGPTQYEMDGEYGNIEVWIANHTWTDSKNTSEVCRLYGNPSPKSPEISPPPAAVAAQIAALARAALGVGNLSVASYVQLTDTEMECDGIISMDRTPKFSDAQIAAIKMANDELVGGQPAACAPMTDSKEAMVVEAVPRWLWGV